MRDKFDPSSDPTPHRYERILGRERRHIQPGADHVHAGFDVANLVTWGKPTSSEQNSAVKSNESGARMSSLQYAIKLLKLA